jgi:peptidoglycan/LPS O-acetylase OafA/YrhL
VILAAAFLGSEDYRAFAALPLAYLLISLAVTLPARLQRVGATNDISDGVYIYAFPLQQLLATVGIHRHGYLLFRAASLAATLPVAAASWWLVEKRALHWKNAAFWRSRPGLRPTDARSVQPEARPSNPSL